MWIWGIGAAAAAAGPFVDLEWRGMAMAGHLSHGPAFAAGAALFDDRLRVGLSGFARPGPINPATFAVPAQGYQGQQTLALRSDGGVMGLQVAPAVHTGALRVDLPLMVGYGGFGFYLTGDDRRTPDGRKPSAWENELMDGRDSSFGLGVEGGLRVAWRVGAHVAPYVVARYTAILGYDAFVRSDYAGPSLGLGLSVDGGRPAGGAGRR